jgi:YVTN family beta-propeller protein
VGRERAAIGADWDCELAACPRTWPKGGSLRTKIDYALTRRGRARACGADGARTARGSGVPAITSDSRSGRKLSSTLRHLWLRRSEQRRPPRGCCPWFTDPNAVAITPDGVTVLVANGDPSNSVIPIDVATRIVGTPIPVGPNPAAIAINPDGATAFVGNFALTGAQTTVMPIDLATRVPGSPIAVGSNPDAVAITPDQAPVAKLSVTTGVAGQPTSFDASASTVQFGTIKSYVWNFGDGSPAATTATAVTTHVYGTAGSYTATVTETDSAGTSTTKVFTGQTMSRRGDPSAIATATVQIAMVRFTG